MEQKVTLIVLLFSCLHAVCCVRGPPRAEQSEVKHVAKVGESVKLRCPIHGYPAPIVSWHKDAEDAAISYAWSRYRTTRRTLKIRSVVKEDTGLYVCKGINGFGKAESRIELVVINPEDFPAMSDTELAELAEPVFTPETVRAAKEVTVAAGASVTLPCAAAGVPAPQLSWYRNSELHRDTAGGGGLELARARAEDSGVYTCMAQNMVGSATLRYRLTVTTGPGRDQSAHAQEAGQEVTSAVRVGRGGTALIDCRVRTHQRPSVKWLKKLEAGEVEAAEAEARTQIISVGEESYRILGDDHQLQQLGPGAWLSQLIVRGARLRDRGMYICFVTSGGRGFNFQQSYLTVIENLATEVEREFPVVAVVVVAALVLVVSLIVAAVVCRVLRRHKLQDSATSDTSSGSGVSSLDTEAGQLLGGGGGRGEARADKSSTPVSGPAPHQLPRPRGGRGTGTTVSAVPPYTQYPQCR